MTTTYPATKAGIKAALMALAPAPAGPNDVAAALWLRGCKGTPGDGCDCPVAHYLRSVLPDDVTVDVSVAGVVVRSTSSPSDIYVDFPELVEDFVTAFDRGDYLDLIK